MEQTSNSLKPQEFDKLLVTVLGQLAERLFVENTNVTYPMKALLLITGLMPALDSQVRLGLYRTGLSGMSTTQFPVPVDAKRANGKKLTRLPFLLGECWTNFASLIKKGIKRSDYPELVQEPGRLFDILLFMQGSDGRELFKFRSGPHRWYELQ